MVRIIAALVADNAVTLLELIGIALIVAVVAIAAGWPWPLLALGVAALLKSAELDAKRRAREPRR